jgi:hypothetical protein
VEHLFFKAVCGRLVLNARAGVIENTLLAGTSGASVAASIATDTLGKLVLPESKSLIGSHSLYTRYLVEASGFDNVTVLAEKLVVCYALFALTVDAALSHNVCGTDNCGLIGIKGVDKDLVSVKVYRGDTLAGYSLYLGDISHSLAGNTDSIYLLAIEAMLGEKLVEAIGIAGLEEYKDLALKLRGLVNEILGEVSSAEIVPYKAVVKLLDALEYGGSYVIAELACAPTEYTAYRTVIKKL